MLLVPGVRFVGQPLPLPELIHGDSLPLGLALGACHDLGLRSLDDGYIPPVFEKWGGYDLLDGKSIVRPRESLEFTRRLADVGIFSGISAGAALAGAVKVADRIESGTIVFVVSDYGWKYLSTGAWTLDLDEAAANAEKVIYF